MFFVSVSASGSISSRRKKGLKFGSLYVRTVQFVVGYDIGIYMYIRTNVDEYVGRHEVLRMWHFRHTFIQERQHKLPYFAVINS